MDFLPLCRAPPQLDLIQTESCPKRGIITLHRRRPPEHSESLVALLYVPWHWHGKTLRVGATGGVEFASSTYYAMAMVDIEEDGWSPRFRMQARRVADSPTLPQWSQHSFAGSHAKASKPACSCRFGSGEPAN